MQVEEQFYHLKMVERAVGNHERSFALENLIRKKHKVHAHMQAFRLRLQHLVFVSDLLSPVGSIETHTSAKTNDA